MSNLRLPVPMNLTMWWNFGSLLGCVLVSQILTGVILAIHYGPEVGLAFSSVDHIMREVNSGWLLRLLHANGASFFFLFLYVHVGRGLYYSSFTNLGSWLTGILLLLVVIASAFLGYVLPWGQIRFWGATVITNLFSALPYVGEGLVQWIWGGFSVQNATLNRFFVLHFILPLVLVCLVIVHLIMLHETGRRNPLGLSSSEMIPFHIYFTIKDIVGFVVFFLLFGLLLFFFPHKLIEPDNYISANPLITPAHIVPEWYFLFAYAILRSIPNKLGGVVGLLFSILILVTLPFMNKMLYKNVYYPVKKLFHWMLLLSFVMLTAGGSWPVEEPYITVRRVFSVLYFSYFVLSTPMRRISEYVKNEDRPPFYFPRFQKKCSHYSHYLGTPLLNSYLLSRHPWDRVMIMHYSHVCWGLWGCRGC